VKIRFICGRTLCSLLALMACGIHGANADQRQFDINLKELRQSPYDIDLKELRRGSAKRARPKPKHRSSISPSPEASPAATTATGENSSYTVRRGDNISLILTGHYGLTQTAAERLIPGVMRMNNLQGTRKLTIGQTLLIPLPLPGKTPSEQAVKREESPPKASPPVPAPPVDTRAITADIQVHEASPCLLASKISEKLGWRAAPPGNFLRSENVAISRGERKLVALCGANPAETYTTERLLARHNTLLLSFEGNEPPRRVTEMILDRLGTPFKRPDGKQGKEELPVTYVIPDISNPGRDLRLTILPAPARHEKPTMPQEKPLPVPGEKPAP